MKNRKKIRWISCVLRYGCTGGAILFPLLLGYQIFQIGIRWKSFSSDSIFLISGLLFWGGLLLLIRLMRRYERLDFFSKESVRNVRLVGLFLVLSELVHFLSIGLSWDFSSLKIALWSSVSDEFKLILLSFAIFLLGYILEEGKALEEERNATI